MATQHPTPFPPAPVDGLDDYAAARVPATQRQSTWDISLVRMGFTVSASDLVFGYTVGLYFGFWRALWISLLISLIVAVISVGMGLIGMRERVSFALSSRFAFGREGSRLPSLVMAVVIALFYGYILGITVDVFPFASHTAAQIGYCIVLGGVFVAISGLGFAKGLKWMGRIGVPLMIVLVIVADIITVVEAGGFSKIVSAHPAKAGQMAVLAILGTGISKWTGGAAVSADIMRFGRNSRAVWTSTAAEFLLGNFGFNLLGLILGLGLKSSDLGAAFGLIGLTGLATLAFLFQSITVETNELYAASLASANAVGLTRRATNIIVGVAGIVIGYWGLAQGVIASFVTFIGYIGYALPVIPGIMLADYFVLNRMRYATPLEQVPAVNWRAVLAFVVTVVLNLITGLVLGDTFWRVLPLFGAVVYLMFSLPQTVAAWRRPAAAAVPAA
jgi:cytosine permease